MLLVGFIFTTFFLDYSYMVVNNDSSVWTLIHAKFSKEQEFELFNKPFMMNNQEGESSDIPQTVSNASPTQPPHPDGVGDPSNTDPTSAGGETSSKRDSTLSLMFIGSYEIMRKQIAFSEKIVNE